MVRSWNSEGKEMCSHGRHVDDRSAGYHQWHRQETHKEEEGVCRECEGEIEEEIVLDF